MDPRIRIRTKIASFRTTGCEGLRLHSELLGMVKTHQDQYESNNSALDTKLAEYQSRGTASSVADPECLSRIRIRNTDF
jgi:hypothetical protein